MVRKLQNLLFNKIMAVTLTAAALVADVRQTAAAARNRELLFPKAKSMI